jgi:Cupin superfamily protein
MTSRLHPEILHPELQLLLQFFLGQRAEPPQAYTHSAAVIPQTPTFFSLGALQTHLNNPLLGPEWMTLMKNGGRVDLETLMLWKTVQTKRLIFSDKTQIQEALKSGAAILLEGIDILDPGINAFLAHVDDAFPCVLANCVAFYSQKGQEAYHGHRDSDDVLVIQIDGQKTWDIYEPQQRRYLGNSPLAPSQMGKKLATLVMNPGDALYVKAGTPHQCRTPGAFSLHLSFDLNDRIPSAEQIANDANNRYNHASATPYQSAEKVIEHYVKIMHNDDFKATMEQMTQQTRLDAQQFRKRIGLAGCIDALVEKKSA